MQRSARAEIGGDNTTAFSFATAFEIYGLCVFVC